MMHKSLGRLADLQTFAFSHGLYVLLCGLIGLFSFVSRSFLTTSNWAQLAIAACFLLAASAGQTLVMITGNIDISIGSIAFLSASTAYLTAQLPPIVSIVAALMVGMLAGLFNGCLVSYFRMNSLLTTLGMLIAYRGISLLATGGGMHSINSDIAYFGRMELFGVLPVVVLISVGLIGAVQIVLRHTKFGVYCYAIGNSELAAVRLGIPVRTVTLIAFCISGTCGATSGLLSAMYLGQTTTFIGRGMEFQSIAAAVIGGTSLFGGTGNVVPGTLAGVLLLNVIDNGLGTRGVSHYDYPFVSGAIILLAIYLDSLKNAKELHVL